MFYLRIDHVHVFGSGLWRFHNNLVCFNFFKTIYCLKCFSTLYPQSFFHLLNNSTHEIMSWTILFILLSFLSFFIGLSYWFFFTFFYYKEKSAIKVTTSSIALMQLLDGIIIRCIFLFWILSYFKIFLWVFRRWFQLQYLFLFLWSLFEWSFDWLIFLLNFIVINISYIINSFYTSYDFFH